MNNFQSFHPNANDTLTIDGVTYRFTEHPTAPGLPYGQSGRRATVYQLANGSTLCALKVFTHAFRTPRIAAGAEQLRPFAVFPGLAVCTRVVLTPERHATLLHQHPDLAYAVLMPWIPGETWQEVLLSCRPVAPELSHALAQSLADILATMEQRGLAHCDLAAPNVMVLPSQREIALIDVEDIYGPGLVRPEKLPSGSAGYAHRTAPQGIWSATADRFAGAVLLAELLGWCDIRVRQIAAGEQYFDPDELQHDSARYQVLLQTLRQRWGGAISEIFARAWHSATLEDCPPLTEWAQQIAALPRGLDNEEQQVSGGGMENEAKHSASTAQARLARSMSEKAEALLALGQVDGAIGELEDAYRLAPQVVAEPYAHALVIRGDAKKQRGDWKEALEDYRTAHDVAPSLGLKDELAAVITYLEGQTASVQVPPWLDQEQPVTVPVGPPLPPEMDVPQPSWWRRSRIGIAAVMSGVVIIFLLAWVILNQIQSRFDQTTATAQAQFQATLTAQEQIFSTAQAQFEATITAQAQEFDRRLATTEAQYQATATAQARALAQAQTQIATTPPPQAQRLHDPIQGELLHKEDNTFKNQAAEVNLRDFITEARFHNPYDPADRAWDYGFTFRDTGQNNEYRLYVESNKHWSLDLVTTTILSGTVENLNIAANGTNDLRLIAVGERAFFFVNDAYIATLPIVERLVKGDVGVATGFLEGHEINGRSTGFQNFTIWSLQSTNPFGGKLNHVEDEFLESLPAEVNLRDFIAEARFHNPYDPAEGAWDYGFIFRDTGENNEYRIYVISDKRWVFSQGSTAILSGKVENLDVSATGSNALRLIADGETAFFFVNGAYITTLPVSGRLVKGDVQVATGLNKEHEINGRSTGFQNFTIWPLDRER